MKKRTRFLASVLSLALTLSLAGPAWAAEGEFTVDGQPVQAIPAGADPEDYLTLGTQPGRVIFTDDPALVEGTESLGQIAIPGDAAPTEYLYWDEFANQYIVDHHPEIYEAFDANAVFDQEYASWWSKEEYMADCELETEEEFKWEMWQYSDALYDALEADDALRAEINEAYNNYLIDTYEAAHPGELATLNTQELLADLGYTETLTPMGQFMKDYEVTTEEEARAFLLTDYIQDRFHVEQTHANFLEYRDRWPDKWAQFDVLAYYDEFNSEYGDSFGTPQEYMAYYHLKNETELAEEMFVLYAQENYYLWIMEEEGGYPWQTVSPTLVVNGTSMPEVAITAESGVSYAPAADLNAILGTALTGEQVSIREAAQAAGWDVVWNAWANQVVLLNRETMDLNPFPQEMREQAAAFGKDLDALFTPDFSKLDDLMARAQRPLDLSKPQKATETTEMTITAFNTLDGDTTAKATLKTQITLQEDKAEIVLTFSGADLLRLLSPQTLQDIQASLPKFKAKDLKTFLTGAKITILVDGETGDVYCNAPILALFTDEVTENTWLHYQDDTLAEAFAALEAGNQPWNTEEILYDGLLTASAESFSAEVAYYNYLIERMELGLVFGADTFTETGDTLTWQLNASKLNQAMTSVGLSAILPADELEDALSIFKELDITLSATKGGASTVDMALRLDTDALGSQLSSGDPAETALYSWLIGLLDMRLEAHATSDATGKGSSTTEFHWKNQVKVELETTTTQTTTSTAPTVTPPAGAEILELGY